MENYLFSLMIKISYNIKRVGQAVAVFLEFKQYRGKSGLHRARYQITSGRREPTESAAENKPPRP